MAKQSENNKVSGSNTAKELEKKKQILQERAERLKIQTEKEKEDDAKVAGVEFTLSDEHYIINNNFVVEIIPLKEFTPLPCTRPFITGIINIRGRIISLIDIKYFLNLPGKNITNLNKVIVVSQNEIEVGILADEVIGQKQITVEKLQKSIPGSDDNNRNFIRGITENQLIYLNMEKLLSNDEIIINDEI